MFAGRRADAWRAQRRLAAAPTAKPRTTRAIARLARRLRSVLCRTRLIIYPSVRPLQNRVAIDHVDNARRGARCLIRVRRLAAVAKSELHGAKRPRRGARPRRETAGHTSIFAS